MDCADCTRHVQHAIAALPGVDHVEVFLASEKALVRLDPQLVDLPAIRQAVAGAGYSVKDLETAPPPAASDFSRQVLVLLGVLFGVILFVIVVGEWLGLFETITERIPLPVGALLVFLAGYPVFKNVVRAAFKRQVISHTLMSVGVLAALAVGEWATALVVVFFMRVGDYVEHFTAERARRAVQGPDRPGAADGAPAARWAGGRYPGGAGASWARWSLSARAKRSPWMAK